MSPDFSLLFNLALAIAGAFGGWILRTVSLAVRDLQAADAKLTDKINNLQVLVVGDYVHRAEFHKTVDAIFETLRRIEEKLDHKQDKL
ncbi:MAG: hypothetical protein N2483_06930 [Burkholderiaceae bacterium]|nr:hypothetical protein [Burkholderiaceae bacterium]